MDARKLTGSLQLSFPTVLIIIAIVLVILSVIAFIFRRGKMMLIFGIFMFLLGSGSAGIAAYVLPLTKIPQYIETYNNISSKIKETGKLDNQSKQDIADFNKDIDKAHSVYDKLEELDFKKYLKNTPFKDVNLKDLKKDLGIDLETYLKGTSFEGQSVEGLFDMKMDVKEIQKALKNGDDLNKLLPQIQ